MWSASFTEKAMATHSSTLAWKIPWMQEPGRLQSMGLLRVRHDWATSLSLFTLVHCRRKWQPTPVFLRAESQGWGEPGGLLSLGLHRVRHDWSNLAEAAAEGKIGEGVHQGCILSPCLFNFYAEYIMRNVGQDEAQVGIKIARKNISNLRYPNDTILKAAKRN